MVDIVITAANVVAGANAATERGLAGETITAGQVVYMDTTTQKYLRADNNSAVAAARSPSGIALNGAALNQPLEVQRSGDITLNGLTAGVAYYLSDTPGGICPVADLLTGEYPCVLGIAKSTTVLALGINYSGVAL